jgi:putative hydrolase of the HAD superfamily
VIEAVLFDFGGVFVGSPFDVIRHGGASLGHDPETVIEAVFGRYDEDNDHPWHRLERGELSLVEAREQLMARAAEQGMDLDPFQVLAATVTNDGAQTEFVERTRQLRADGYRTALITNNIAEFRDGWRSLVPVDELFEVVVDSCEVGMRKPNPRMFLLATELLGGIAPEHCVFLDDFAGNVRAAEALGMKGIVVGLDRSAAIGALDRILTGN